MCNVCAECIGEMYLREHITRDGVVDRCNFCQSDENPTIELDGLGERVHEVIDKYFYLTPSEAEGYEYYLAREGLWERDGYPVDDLLQDLVGVEPEISSMIHEWLSDKYDAWGKDALCEDQPYDSDAQYAEKEIDTLDFLESWSFFKHNIRAKSRFFNQHAKEVLDTIFQNLGILVTGSGESVIQEFPVDDPASDIYRARIALTFKEREEIILGLPKSLGAPPHKHAISGRMNAGGISMFYGAKDVETCITEVRAPVGSSVVVGKFQPLRSINILDLNRLQSIDVTGSYFDPNHITEVSRANFLEHLVVELSSPVLPGSEEREYLSTQVVAEYLAQLDDLNLDGVMFKSSQMADDGQNIVLFNHASDIEKYELPKGAKVNVSFCNGDPDDYDPTITVCETVPPIDDQPQPESEEPCSFSVAMFDELELHDLDKESLSDPTLRLDLESVKVHEVQGVKYKSLAVDVGRHRMEKNERTDF